MNFLRLILNPISIKQLSEFAYLFIMDICEIPFNTFSSYEKNEPQFAEHYFKGFLEAFHYKTNGLLSHEFIKYIHQIATQHLQNSITPGDYRNTEGHFDICTPYMLELQDFQQLLRELLNLLLNGLKIPKQARMR